MLDSKVENENFYLLTLVAMAKEMKSRGIKEAKIKFSIFRKSVILTVKVGIADFFG